MQAFTCIRSRPDFGSVASIWAPTLIRWASVRRRAVSAIRGDANRFGVLYLGDTVKVCFLEAVLRDQRDGVLGDLPIAESELYDRHFAEIEVTTPLTMVDLRDDGPIKMGVPTDVAKGSKQSLARKWAAAFNEHVSQVDGIIYPSRLNGHTNLAVFDRAVGKLKAVGTTKLIRAPGLADVLNDLNVAIVETDP